jgi:hypothetical protein
MSIFLSDTWRDCQAKDVKTQTKEELAYDGL